MNLRSSVVSAIYNKALVISVASLSRKTLGEITNLMSVDSTRLQVTMCLFLFEFRHLELHFSFISLYCGDFQNNSYFYDNCALKPFVYTSLHVFTGLDPISARGVVFSISNCRCAVLPIPTNGRLLLCRYECCQLNTMMYFYIYIWFLVVAVSVYNVHF